MDEKTPDFDHDPGEMQDLEAKCPNMVRFFRQLIKGGTEEAQSAQKHVQEHIALEAIVTASVENRLPGGMILMILAELAVPHFKSMIRRFTFEPDDELAHKEVRKYVKEYFSSEKGINFDYKVPDDA